LSHLPTVIIIIIHFFHLFFFNKTNILFLQRGNGEDYKQIPNSQKAWEIPAYPLLLQTLRTHLGPTPLITAAVPGLERDMLAFTPTTVPQILSSIDFLNVMTYDLFNRRDNITKHHTGVRASKAALRAYMRRGADACKLNLGFAFYVRWALTEGACERGKEVGCPTGLMEDPVTGGDLGRAGAFSYHDEVPADLKDSYERALSEGTYDEIGGGYYYWDEEEKRFWTFDTPEAIAPKFEVLVRDLGLGGVFAWGLGEDADEFRHLRVVDREMGRLWRDRDEERREL